MTNHVWTTAVAGVLAGLGVAMPLGAIGALILREGVANGFRAAAAAAAGVATVDLVYCLAATTFGALLSSRVEEHRGIFLIASGVLVLAIGLNQLRRGMKRRNASVPAEAARISAVTAYARFVVLTAINPMTLVYFFALSGVATDPGGSWVSPAILVLAAGFSSLAWQLALAGAGSLLGASVHGGAVHLIDILASAIILSLGAGIIVKGIQSIAVS